MLVRTFDDRFDADFGFGAAALPFALPFATRFGFGFSSGSSSSSSAASSRSSAASSAQITTSHSLLGMQSPAESEMRQTRDIVLTQASPTSAPMSSSACSSSSFAALAAFAGFDSRFRLTAAFFLAACGRKAQCKRTVKNALCGRSWSWAAC